MASGSGTPSENIPGQVSYFKLSRNSHKHEDLKAKEQYWRQIAEGLRSAPSISINSLTAEEADALANASKKSDWAMKSSPIWRSIETRIQSAKNTRNMAMAAQSRNARFDESLQKELEGLDAYLKRTETYTFPQTPYRIIFGVGLAYIGHGGDFDSDAYRSNLGMLTKWLAEMGATQSFNNKLTVVIAFDPLFNQKIGNLTRLQYDINRINKQARDALFEHKKRSWQLNDKAAIITHVSEIRSYPKKDSQAYFIGTSTVLLCINRLLETSYPTPVERAVESARGKIGTTLQSLGARCPPADGSDYKLLEHFCQKHRFQEVGIYNCAYVDERVNENGAMVQMRTNKYFDNMCELLHIAYSCGTYRFLLDTTMGSIEHPDSMLVVNRRVNPYSSNQPSRSEQKAFLTVFPLDDRTTFKVGYRFGTYDGGKRKTRTKRRSTRKLKKRVSSA